MVGKHNAECEKKDPSCLCLTCAMDNNICCVCLHKGHTTVNRDNIFDSRHCGYVVTCANYVPEETGEASE